MIYSQGSLVQITKPVTRVVNNLIAFWELGNRRCKGMKCTVSLKVHPWHKKALTFMDNSGTYICDFLCLVSAKELDRWWGHQQNYIPDISSILAPPAVTHCLKIPTRSKSWWFLKQFFIQENFSLSISGWIQPSLPFKTHSCLRSWYLGDTEVLSDALPTDSFFSMEIHFHIH